MSRKQDDTDYPDRKKPVHGILYFEGKPTIIFDTVCTKDRKRILDNTKVHQLLREVWSESTAWLVGRYVIMPDHIHFFAGMTQSEIAYENWIRYWKSNFSKQLKDKSFRWQSSHWDTRMRNEEQYEEKWNYVTHNPVRHGLVSDPEEWPYRGELHSLLWSL